MRWCVTFFRRVGRYWRTPRSLFYKGRGRSGKSTWARQIAGSSALQVTLDDRLVRSFARDDPEQFVLQNPEGLLVIDEAQRAPELTLALKATVDADRRPGRFLLTGSVDLLQARGLGDSLAGRKETVRVYRSAWARWSAEPTPKTS